MLIEVLFDIRIFSRRRMQMLAENTWTLKEGIYVRERYKSNYVIYFEKEGDQRFFLQNRIYVIEGALLVMDSWTENMDLHGFIIRNFSVWMQILCLPLEYKVSKIARMITKTASSTTHVDWENALPRTHTLHEGKDLDWSWLTTSCRLFSWKRQQHLVLDLVPLWEFWKSM